MTTQSSDPLKAVPTRRISFEETLRTMPKHFAAEGDLIESHLAACMSSVFPDGEDFFVRSVRHYRDQITDPALRKQVAGFIGQESVHGREHRALNDRLAELGYDVKRGERITKRVLEFRTRHVPPIANLALTAALEHFTATMAEILLGDPEVQARFGDPAVRDLFMWHALEESEHKAVAFDVYRAVGGSERLRIFTMRFTRFGFVAVTALSVVLSMLRDRETYRRGNLSASIGRLRTSPLVSRNTWEMLKEYERRGFHPDDRDTDDLTTRWRDELFGAEGRLSDLVAGSSAA